jgi:two-component system, sensor histidine kinase and response regulator
MQSPQPSTSIDLQARKILLVDDDRLNLRILSNILKSEGYALASAASGEEALELYETFKPDLVLLDVVMPGIDGFETCRRIRASHQDNSAPVIFITAKSESDDVVEGLSAGGVDYLPKPFRPKEALARIRTHMQLKILLEQQKNLVDQLSNANSAKNKFLGMAAHDLRNPLASIRGLAEFLQEGIVGNLTADQLDLVKSIHEASQGMLDMVNELLDLATIEAGELQVHPERKNLVEVIEKAVYHSNIQAAKKGTKIFFRPDYALVELMIDSAKMKQVLDNLLSNAVKYSPPGSSVQVQLAPMGNTWTFSVIDQGPGIPTGEMDRLFKDFSRLSVKPTGGEKSTGLGLAICRKIVESHQGSVSAENIPGGGCRFTVILPSLL